MKKNQKIVAGGTALLLALGLGVAAVGSTSAYFSDTNSGGAISADYGSIYVDVNGQETSVPTIDLGLILPGETKSGSITVKNDGKSSQDVYVQFTDTLILGAINTLGTYGEIEISVTNNGVTTTAFHSANLNPAAGGALPSQVLLVEDLAAGDSVTVTFEFTYAAKATGQVPNLPLVTDANLPGLDYKIVATQPNILPGQTA